MKFDHRLGVNIKGDSFSIIEDLLSKFCKKYSIGYPERFGLYMAIKYFYDQQNSYPYEIIKEIPELHSLYVEQQEDDLFKKTHKAGINKKTHMKLTQCSQCGLKPRLSIGFRGELIMEVMIHFVIHCDCQYKNVNLEKKVDRGDLFGILGLQTIFDCEVIFDELNILQQKWNEKNKKED